MRQAIGFLIMLMLMPGMASAKPERMALKSDETKAREEHARALAKKIDLSKVDDPDTRLILSAILGAMDLDSRKPTEDKTHAPEILEHGRRVQ